MQHKHDSVCCGNFGWMATIIDKDDADHFEKNHADHTERADHLVYSQLED